MLAAVELHCNMIHFYLLVTYNSVLHTHSIDHLCHIKQHSYNVAVALVLEVFENFELVYYFV